MPDLKTSSFTLLLYLFISVIAAEDIELIGCNELSCPKEGANDRCTVEDNTFLGIGLSPIPNAPSAFEGISLLKGVNVSSTGLAGKDNDKPTRTFKSVYYMATPEDTDTQDLNGCVVIFNNAPKKKFKHADIGNTNGTDTLAATGTCSDVIEQSCIDSITKRASSMNVDAKESLCGQLEQELKQDFDACSGFGGQGASLGNFSIKSIRDLDAVDNSSNCWPVKRQSDQLMKIAEITAFANYSATALVAEAYKISPVLTVFGQKNDGSVGNSPQLMCLKVVTAPSTSADGGSENAAVLSSGSWFAISLAVLVGITRQL